MADDRPAPAPGDTVADDDTATRADDRSGSHAAAVGGLLERVTALDHAVEIGRRHDLGDDIDAAARIATSARTRLRHGTAHTVVALAGSTGSGKSSLLNAVTGAAVADTGLTRPTTETTQAVVYPGRSDGDAGSRGAGGGADGLLDWLDVRRRHHLPAVTAQRADPITAQRADRATAPPADHATPPADHSAAPHPDHAAAPTHDLRGLVLLDLPDFDSTMVAHRAEVERLVALVDLMVWVTDPQKYADQALHRDFLAPLASHAQVIEVVLNKIDTLDDAAVRRCLADLDRLLDDDGMPDVHPLAVSATTGQGLPALRALLAAEVAARTAVLDRVDADLAVAAARLGVSLEGGARAALDQRAGADLVARLASAVGVDEVAALVAAQHRRDAVLRTGWPPLRWMRRFRSAPIAALPRAAASPVARAEVSQALRNAAQVAGDGVEPPWRPALRRVTTARTDDVVEALDRRTSVGVATVAGAPRWWTAVAAVHGVLLGLAVIGAVWLAALFLADALLLLDLDALTPRVRAIPLPTVLLVGGLAAGLLLAVLLRPLVALGARRRAATARRQLLDDVGDVADDEVVGPLEAVLTDRRELVELHAVVAGRA